MLSEELQTEELLDRLEEELNAILEAKDGEATLIHSVESEVQANGSIQKGIRIIEVGRQRIRTFKTIYGQSP